MLLVDLSERERHELGEQLRAAGFDVMIALNHTDVCLRLLTWRPDGVIADGDFGRVEIDELANVIRTSAAVPAAMVLLCGSLRPQPVSATVLVKPVAFVELLSALREGLTHRDGAQLGRRREHSKR